MPFLNKAVFQRSFGPTVLSNRPVVRLMAEPLSVEQRAAIVGEWDRAVAALEAAFVRSGLDGPQVTAIAEPAPAQALAHEALAGLVARCAVCMMAAASCPWPAGNASPSDDGRILAYWNDWVTGAGVAAGRQAVRLVETAFANSEATQGIIEDALKAVFDARPEAFIYPMFAKAERSGLPWRLAWPGTRILSFGQGARQQWFHGTMSNRQSRASVHLTMRKHLSVGLLRAAGLPVPEHLMVRSHEEARAAAAKLGFPLVVKPDSGSLSKDISLHLTNEDAVAEAVRKCLLTRPRALVEKQYSGLPYRITICNGRALGALRNAVTWVRGDGRNPLRRLIEDVNRTREKVVHDPYKPPFVIRVEDFEAELHVRLKEQGISLDDIPPSGRDVFLTSTPSPQRGGVFVDVSDHAHPSTLELAEEAARVLHTDSLGVDIISPDISQPHEEVPLVINEVNAAPGVRNHFIVMGTPRDQPRAVLSPFFQPGDEGRIPIAASFAGLDNNCLRVAEKLLTALGERVGFADAKVAEVDGYRLRPKEGEAAHPGCALLRDKRPTLAVMAVQPYDALVRGLPSDRLDVIALVPELFGSLDNPASQRAARTAVGLPGTALVLPLETAAAWPIGESPHRQMIFVAAKPDLAAPPEGWVVAVEGGAAEIQLTVYRGSGKDSLGRLSADHVAQDAAQDYAWAAALALGLGLEPLAIARQITALANRPATHHQAGGAPA